MDGMFFGIQNTDRFGKFDAMSGEWRTGFNNNANMIPENYGETILYFEPNGMMPLQALLGMMPAGPNPNSPYLHWFTDVLPERFGEITAVFTDPMLQNAYAGGGVNNDAIYLHVPAATAQLVREGSQILLRMAPVPGDPDDQIRNGDPRLDVTARVTYTDINSVNSVIGLVLLENDDNAPAETTPGGFPAAHIGMATHISVLGNVNPEGSALPDGARTIPREFENYTQIFLDSLAITRTAQETHTQFSKDGNWAHDVYKMQREHGLGMEFSLLYSVRSKRLGKNNQPMRTTHGLIPWIKDGGLVSDYRTETNPIVAGKTWQQGWFDWLTWAIGSCLDYGMSTERMVFCGRNAFLAINRAIRNDPSRSFDLVPETVAYGYRVSRLVTPLGDIYLKEHPLLTRDPQETNTMVIFDPTDMQRCALHETQIIKGDQAQRIAGPGWVDASMSAVLTEVGLKYFAPFKCAYLTGFEFDNRVTP